MKTKPPRNRQEFTRYLRDAFDTVKDAHTSDHVEEFSIADLIEEISVLACRFGAGDLIDPQRHTMTPREALVVVGRLLAWAEQELSPTLDVYELAMRLGCTVRTVWRMEAKGLIPPARRVGRLVRWDREEIEDWLEKQAALN